MDKPVVQIQLLEGTGYLNIKEGTQVPITQSISELKDLAAKKGGHTKTVTVVGDNESNVTIGHLFDVNIQTGNFNRNAKTPVVLLQDNVPVLRGNMILLQVNKMSPSNNTWDQEVTYEVTIQDTTSTFFLDMGEKYLTDLDFSDYDHYYSTDKVMNTINNTVADGYKYLWPTCAGNSYKLDEFKPGIYAKGYWDKIFSSNGYTYTWASLTSPEVQFDKAIIPYGGDTVVLSPEDYERFKVRADTSSREVLFDQLTLGDILTSGPDQFIVDNEIDDQEGGYNPVTGEYTTPFALSAQKPVVYYFTVTGNIALRNNEGSRVYLRRYGEGFGSTDGGFRMNINCEVGSGNNSVSYQLPQTYVVQSGGDGSGNSNSTIQGPGGAFYWANIDPNSDLDLPTQTFTFTISFPNNSVNIQIGSIIKNFFKFIAQAYQNGLPFGQMAANQRPFWSTQGPLGSAQSTARACCKADVDVVYKVSSLTMGIDPSAAATSFGIPIRMNQYIPKKVKQRDFIKAVATLYNLYINVDPLKDNNLLIYRRDEFYDTGTEKDWTTKLCLDLPSKMKFAPDVVKKRLTLSYTEAKDVVNTGYKNSTSEVYGEITYTFDNENVTGETRTTTAFEPSPTDPTNFGVIGLAVNGAAPKTGMRIVYDGGLKQSTSPYIIYDAYQLIGYQGSDYCYSGHFDDPNEPTFDLNFGICERYFGNTIYNGPDYFTNNNMYNLNWRRTINQINTGRILEAKFDLDQADILQLNLNDKIYIKDAWWNILAVKDYNAAGNSPTTVELISVDSDLRLAPVTTRSNVSYPPREGQKTTRKLTDEISDYQTLQDGGWNNRVVGNGNFFGYDANTNFVIGDDNVINGSNNFVRGNGITVDGSNQTVAFFTNIYSAGIDIVLSQFPVDPVNFITAGVDTVSKLGSTMSINIITGGVDKV